MKMIIKWNKKIIFKFLYKIKKTNLEFYRTINNLKIFLNYDFINNKNIKLCVNEYVTNFIELYI